MAHSVLFTARLPPSRFALRCPRKRLPPARAKQGYGGPTVALAKMGALLFVTCSSASAQRRLGFGFDRGPVLHELVEPIVGADADSLVGLSDLAADVRQLIDEHLVL